DRLRQRFGLQAVFMDVASIAPGADFVDAIEDAVGRCDALVAIIAPNWLSITSPRGGRRLDDPDDVVRLEIETALTRGILVVPVLVDRAEMPSSNQLPIRMARLARRNAIELSDTRWDYDVDQLLTAMEDQAGGRVAVPARRASEAP